MAWIRNTRLVNDGGSSKKSNQTSSTSSKLYNYNNSRKNSRVTSQSYKGNSFQPTISAAEAQAEAERQRKIEEYNTVLNRLNNTNENINLACRDLMKALELLKNAFSGEKANQIIKETEQVAKGLNQIGGNLNLMSKNASQKIKELGGTPRGSSNILYQSTISPTNTANAGIYRYDEYTINGKVLPLLSSVNRSIEDAGVNLSGTPRNLAGCENINDVAMQIDDAQGDIKKVKANIEEAVNADKKLQQENSSIIDRLSSWFSRIFGKTSGNDKDTTNTKTKTPVDIDLDAITRSQKSMSQSYDDYIAKTKEKTFEDEVKEIIKDGPREITMEDGTRYKVDIIGKVNKNTPVILVNHGANFTLSGGDAFGNGGCNSYLDEWLESENPGCKNAIIIRYNSEMNGGPSSGVRILNDVLKTYDLPASNCLTAGFSAGGEPAIRQMVDLCEQDKKVQSPSIMLLDGYIQPRDYDILTEDDMKLLGERNAVIYVVERPGYTSDIKVHEKWASYGINVISIRNVHANYGEINDGHQNIYYDYFDLGLLNFQIGQGEFPSGTFVKHNREQEYFLETTRYDAASGEWVPFDIRGKDANEVYDMLNNKSNVSNIKNKTNSTEIKPKTMPQMPQILPQ